MGKKCSVSVKKHRCKQITFHNNNYQLSRTNLTEWSKTSRAVRIGGNPSLNLTSTTAPMTWHTCPIAPFPVNSSVILPLPFFSSDFGEGESVAAVAVEVAYWEARERRNP